MHAEDIGGKEVKGRGTGRRRAAFLDRDGVINVNHGYVFRQQDFDFVPGTLEACATLSRSALALVVVTNQSGIGRGYYDEADFARLTDWMRERFVAAGAPLAGVYHCPHHPTEALPAWRHACDCRKPAPGLLLRAAVELNLDLAGSLMFGDHGSDLEAARAAGVATRVWLATDGVRFAAPGLPAAATHRFLSLREAVADPGIRRLLDAD